MSLTENGGNGMVMPVAPMYGGGYGSGFGGFGGDGWWVILFLFALMGNGMWGGGFGGGYGNMMLGYDFPWLMNGQQGINNNVSDGFRDAQLHDSVTSVRDGISSLATQVCNSTGQIQNSLCSGFAGVTATVSDGFANAEIANNARQMANMQQAFAQQTATSQGFNQLGSQLANCCCENRLGTADLKYTIATENCADRAAISDGIRDVMENCNRNNQAVLDKLCQLELDGVKAQVEAKNDRIAELTTALNMATLRESQTAQNAFISQGFANEVDQLYNRLSNCPVPTTPVYGRTPIFTCPQNQFNNGCGCGQF